MSASLTARRALESLRAGVPNRDAVQALGFNEDALLEQFSERLGQVTSGTRDGSQPHGLLVAAEFGGGKSHALEYLSHRALGAGFAVSKVVISKETQLFNPAKVFSAAMDSLQVADRTGSVLDEIALSRLDAGHPRFDDFSVWLGSSGLNSRFDATMYLHREAGANEELQQRLVSFWGGGPLQVAQLKKDLRSCGAAGLYPIEKIGAKDLARERFKFMSRLLCAAGYNGWLILLDELELIGRYSFLQRGRSYAELCRLMGLDEGSAIPGLFVVGAITPDFETAVIREGKDDINQIGFRFRARGDADSDLTAALAERMMLGIQRSCVRLPEPDSAALRRTLLRLAEVYGEAYGVPPSTQEPDGISVGWQMREYVRSWITRWDLQRMDPTYVSRTEVERIEQDYGEDELLEQSSQADEPVGYEGNL